MSYSKEELVEYRLKRAKESLEDGKILMANKSWNTAANRMYYACFYGISAYLAKMEIKANTHTGLKAAFNRELVRTGKMDKENGKLFNTLFGMRQEADYEDFFSIEKADLEPMIDKVRLFILRLEQIIEKA